MDYKEGTDYQVIQTGDLSWTIHFVYPIPVPTYTFSFKIEDLIQSDLNFFNGL